MRVDRELMVIVGTMLFVSLVVLGTVGFFARPRTSCVTTVAKSDFSRLWER